MIGQIFDGRYKIARLLGEGGMGAVYEALDQTTNGTVAVKVITANVAKNANLVARFHREAKAAAAIATDEIVQVLETGTDPTSGLPYMVMEYLEGEDLAHLFKRLGPLPVDLALRIGAQACITLEKAHEARVIHRDIKPANLFLAKTATGERRIKLLDFGVAKIKLESAAGVDTSGLTRTGSMLGSPLYMSPEQARGQKVIDARADLWSLGVVLYQALTGRRPHQDIDGLGELIIAICSELPRPLVEHAPWVPADVAAVVHAALQFAPEDRYQTAKAMLEAITKHLPSGYAIEDSMLVSMTSEERSKERLPAPIPAAGMAPPAPAPAPSPSTKLSPMMTTLPLTASSPIPASPAKTLDPVSSGQASKTVVRQSHAPVDDVAATVAFEREPEEKGQGFVSGPNATTMKSPMATAPGQEPKTSRSGAIPVIAPAAPENNAKSIAVAIAVVVAIALATFAYFELRHGSGGHKKDAPTDQR